MNEANAGGSQRGAAGWLKEKECALSMKKFLTDLAAFAIADVAVLIVVSITLFSVTMTARIVEQHQKFGFIPFELVVACVVLTILTIGSAMKMAYDAFEEFRNSRG